MPKKPHDEDPQYPFLSEAVKGSAIVDTPNGIARDMGLSPDQLALGARNEKGLENTWGKITTRRSTGNMATGNRSGE